MAKHVASTFLTLLIGILAIVAGMVVWGKHEFTAPGPSTLAQCIEVARGAELAPVADELAASGAITNAYLFRVGADYTERASKLKFGNYLVPAGASMDEVLDIITRGGASTCGTEVTYRIGVRENSVLLRDIDPATGTYDVVEEYNPAEASEPAIIADARQQAGAKLRLAVAEGTTVWQVVEGLREAPFLSGEIENLPDEGSLAPDTYEVKDGTPRGEILAAMETRQAAILQDAWDSRMIGLPYETPYDALIMASIVEKETGVPDERDVVAAVFVNRLGEGMRLQTDPTVIYGVTEGKGILGRGLRRSELDRETPWNTYQIDGLPKTPIANPGRAAIEAALHPAESDYLYFVADGTGGHAFGRTLAEHEANVARWREIEAENRP